MSESEFIKDLKSKSESSVKKADRFCQSCENVTNQEKAKDIWKCLTCNKYQI